MADRQQFPRPYQVLWLEWRARRIQDPLARLRYLRRATAPVTVKHRKALHRARKVCLVLAVGLLLATGRDTPQAAGRGPVTWQPPASPVAERIPDVWLVERNDAYEAYSNGLRIETLGVVSHHRRSYRFMVRATGEVRSDGTQPAGIIYHTTESHIAPFQASQNGRLQRVGRWLLDYVRRRRSYHYLIDRFGRVHYVVSETDSADHAGASIWADRERLYVNLNHSFLAVALETQTQAGDKAAALTPAQLHACKVLTEMLRSRYSIAAPNCITHAQVSVNPHSFRVGNHTDWAANFPFAEIGLPDNYSLPVASMVDFGFGYDQDFVAAAGSRLWNGLTRSEEQVRQRASAQAMTVAQYRTLLKDKYRQITASFPEKHFGSAETKESNP